MLCSLFEVKQVKLFDLTTSMRVELLVYMHGHGTYWPAPDELVQVLCEYHAGPKSQGDSLMGCRKRHSPELIARKMEDPDRCLASGQGSVRCARCCR